MPWRLGRSALSACFFLSYGIAALPFALLLFLPVFPPAFVRRVVRIFYCIFVFCARVTGLYRVVCDDATRTALDSCRGKIVVANHISLIDICILMAHLPDATAIAKSATRNNPFLGMVVRRMFIVPSDDPMATLAAARTALGAGLNVIVFPQGTRGGTAWQRGAAHLALTSRVPLALFRLDYDPVVLAKGQPWWDVGARTIRIYLSTCGIIYPTGVDGHRTAVALTQQLKEKLI